MRKPNIKIKHIIPFATIPVKGVVELLQSPLLPLSIIKRTIILGKVFCVKRDDGNAEIFRQGKFRKSSGLFWCVIDPPCDCCPWFVPIVWLPRVQFPKGRGCPERVQGSGLKCGVTGPVAISVSTPTPERSRVPGNTRNLKLF